MKKNYMLKLIVVLYYIIHKVLFPQDFECDILNRYFFKYNNKIYSIETYNIFDENFEKSKKIIKKLENVSYDKFIKIKGKYLITRNKIFYLEKEIENIDLKSFEILSDNLSKDKNNVYYENKKVDVNSKNFRIIDKYHYTDGNIILYLSQNMLGLRATMENLFYIYNVDLKSYNIIDRIYSKDKSNVFYENEIIKGADPNSFTKINTKYSKDKNNVFYRDEIIKEANPNNFEILSNNYSRDNNWIFWKDYKIAKYNNKFKILDNGLLLINGILYDIQTVVTKIDIKTFKKIDNYLWIDKTNVYYRNIDSNSIIINDDMSIKNDLSFRWEKFKKLKYSYYTDGNSIYYNSNVISKDIKGFKILSKNFSKDAKNIYYKGKKIKEIDINNFKIIGNDYIKDNKNVYFKGKKLKVTNVENFQKLKCGLFVDGYNVYDIE